MKILLAPLLCTIETSGPMQRAVALAETFLQAGHRVAFCTADNRNYRKVEGTEEHLAANPEPLGLPRPFGQMAVALAFHCGMLKRKEVTSFEFVLHMMGILHPGYFLKDVEFLRSIIQTFKPDIVYSEFRLPAIVAAKLEGVLLAGSCSYPGLPAYRCDPQYSEAVREKLRCLNLPNLDSILDLFSWQTVSFIASSPTLEPVKLDNPVHVGPFFDIPEPGSNNMRSKITVYMGNSAIRPHEMLRELRAVAARRQFDIYIASTTLHPAEEANLHIAPRFDFGKLLLESILFIHHGGQNSSMSGLLAGVPQLIFPGKVFERCFNADSIVQIGAGIRCVDSDFTAPRLDSMIDTIKNNNSFYSAARDCGRELRSLGGASKTLSVMEDLVHR